MKENIKKVARRVIIASLAFSCLLACKKEEKSIEPTKSIQETQRIDVEVLKNYMAELINTKIENIKYDEKTRQFSVFGVDQISQEKLTEFYNEAKK